MGTALAVLTMAAWLSACTTAVPTPPPDAAADPHAAWARVLTTSVSPTGSIDFRALAARPGDLEAYVAWAAAHGPQATPALFPTRAERLAYHLNTYNALAMYNAITSSARPADTVRFFFFTRLPVDGRAMSLYTYENDVIRPYGEPRIHFALNCMVRGCPRLPQVPWSAATLDQQLDAAARLFVSEARNVRVDPATRTVHLSAIFDFYPDDFLAVAPSLPAYVNRYRAEPVPEDYTVEFIPYDWTLNQTPDPQRIVYPPADAGYGATP